MKIEHWAYNDGWRFLPEFLRKDPKLEWEFESEYLGWSCWVYPDKDQDLVGWVEANFEYEYDLTHRFNGGYPMFTFQISNKNDVGRFVRYAEKHNINLRY
jgi:hypothetical protein